MERLTSFSSVFPFAWEIVLATPLAFAILKNSWSFIFVNVG